MAMNGPFSGLSASATMSAPSPRFPQNALSSSMGSLSANGSRQSSHVSKTYRQASTLFLTRRLPEALTTILPLITPPDPLNNGELAPVARSSRSTKIKVWSLYLTILNAIVEMEPDEGKDAFGQQEWKALCTRVREGNVWEEIVDNGYHGVEGDVDCDVVINLATILLAHARDQHLNQKRLEAWLANCQTPSFDLGSRLAASPSPARGHERSRSRAKGASGANTPRDLNARIKILELYTLHVLLRNNQWEYSREFISMSPILDEERREAFLQALQSLQEEQEEQERLAQEEQHRQEEQLKREVEEARRLRQENEDREQRRLEEERARREASETDYGIESTPSIAGSSKSGKARAQSDASFASRPSKSSISRTSGKNGPQGPLTFTARANMIITRFRSIIDELARSLNSNPALLMRMLAFVIGFILMMGNRSLRERVQRVLGASWAKVKATAGMGTKVSYI